jgi:hypothetical protein
MRTDVRHTGTLQRPRTKMRSHAKCSNLSSFMCKMLQFSLTQAQCKSLKNICLRSPAYWNSNCKIKTVGSTAPAVFPSLRVHNSDWGGM